MRSWAVLTLLCGCGRIAFDPFGHAAGGDGGAGDDSGVTDGIDAPMSTNSVCPTMVALSDDFNAATMSPIWTAITSADMTYAQTGGLLELTFGAHDSAGEFTGYETANTLVYAEACAIVELDMVPDPSVAGSVSLQIGNAVYVLFEEAGGNLISDRKGGVVDSRPWDPVAHRFLRLRGHAGTWYWDVSPDGNTFTTLASVAFQVDGGLATYLKLEAGSSSAVNNGGRADFNSVVVLTQ